VTIEQRHVNAFNEYGTTPVFINNKTVSCVYDSLLEKTAEDTAVLRHGTALFKCPVPGCMQIFGPAIPPFELYHLSMCKTMSRGQL
jgi:hypothetical protein